MIKLNNPSCNFNTGEYESNALYDIALDNSINDGLVSSWQSKSPMTYITTGGLGFSIGTKGYVCGGYNGSSYLNTVLEYDSLTGTWSTKASMNSVRRSGASFSISGKGYVVGGEITIGGTKTETVEMYDPDLNTWVYKASISTGRAYMASFVINGKGYIVGGEPVTNYVAMYNPDLDTWTAKAVQPTALILQSGFSIGTNGYACGGRNSVGTRVNSVYCYDSLTDTWSTKASLPQVLEYTTGFNVSNSGYIVGGNDGSTYLSTTYRYNHTSNVWEVLGSLNGARREPASFVIDDRGFICGGYNGSSYLSSVEAVEALTTEVYYTVDGTDPLDVNQEPTGSAVLYTVPFNLEIPSNLKFAAIPTNAIYEFTASDTTSLFYTLTSQWRLPKYDWLGGDGVNEDDMNRIESNIQFIKTRSLTSSNGWESKLGSRALGTEYTNETGKMIIVAVGSSSTSAGLNRFYVNDILVDQDQIAASTIHTLKVEVPAGSKYKVDWSAGTGSISHWVELS